MPRFLAATMLIAMQLSRNPVNLYLWHQFLTAKGIARWHAYRKNATREIDRSSCGDREEAKIERKTAGVTGMRLAESDGGC